MHFSSKLILGTVQFGLAYGINNAAGQPSEKDVFTMLDHAAKHGVNILDTADAYGNARELIGKYHLQSGYRFSINTKFHFSPAQSILQQLQQSLRILDTDCIDTYFFHRFDDIHHPGSLEELAELKSMRLIKKTGVSVYTNEELTVAMENDDVDVIQLPFNLLDNNTQRGTLLNAAKRLKKEIQVRSIFLQGLFFKDSSAFPLALQPLQPYIQLLQKLALKWDRSIESLALNYALSQAGIDFVLLGVDNLEQLKRNLEQASDPLPGELVQQIDAIEVKEVRLLYPKNWN